MLKRYMLFTHKKTGPAHAGLDLDGSFDVFEDALAQGKAATGKDIVIILDQTKPQGAYYHALTTEYVAALDAQINNHIKAGNTADVQQMRASLKAEGEAEAWDMPLEST
jgi:hypothetical protein